MTAGGVVVVGVGGHGRELFDLARSCGLDPIGYLDDAVPPGDHDFGLIVGTTAEPPDTAHSFIAGIGAPAIREQVVARLEALGLVACAPLVHPTAVIGDRVELSAGCAIGAGTVVTVDVEIGPHVHVHANGVVAHDCVLGDYATLTPRVALAGDVRIGPRSFIGVGATLNRGITVGADTIVGAGSVVIGDVEPGRTVVGVPARPIGGD